MSTFPSIFLSFPSVYAVGKNYVIAVPVNQRCYMWVKVGEKTYYDVRNGTLRKFTPVHLMTVPMEELDAAKEYTVCWRIYDSDKDIPLVEEYVSAFRPIDPEQERINMYQIADAHNLIDQAIASARYYEAKGEDLDLLIVNGDIFNDRNELHWYGAMHKLAGDVSRGVIPVVQARGNHDNRGEYAEFFADYMPSENGRSYYTFRLGPIWGMVLDCGEDKPDDHEEYNYANAFAPFRVEETRWLESVAYAPVPEYREDGIKYRMVVCHIPFSFNRKPPFDLEDERYRYWLTLLRETVKPHFVISGHVHDLYVSMPGSEYDARGQACPLVVGGKPEKSDGVKRFTGCAMTLCNGRGAVKFVDNELNVRGEEDFGL